VIRSPGRQGKVNFQVAESTPEEIVLKTKDGQRIRVDRKVDMHIEFIAETRGWFQIPYKFESIAVDSVGKAEVKLVRDCSRSSRADVSFMSETETFVTGCEKR
jgi:hypothetical protein